MAKEDSRGTCENTGWAILGYGRGKKGRVEGFVRVLGGLLR